MINGSSSGFPAPEVVLRDIMERRGWDVRSGQLSMVEHIQKTVLDGSGPRTATIGAPTGTGKSLGILCGIVPTGRRVIVTTSTKALQNQLRNSELPRFAADLYDLYGESVDWTVLKGKGNYPCYHVLKKYIDEIGAGDSLFGSDDTDPDNIIRRIWHKTTEAVNNGDWANLDCEDEINSLPRDYREHVVDQYCSCTNQWFSASSSVGTPQDALNLGFDKMCFYSYAYAYAMLCQVVVMNTHLLVMEGEKYGHTTPRPGFDGGVATLHEVDMPVVSQLRGTSVVAMDEAHHVPEIVSSCMSVKIDLENMSADIKKDVELLRKLDKGFSPSTAPALKKLSKRVGKLVVDGRVPDSSRDTVNGILIEAGAEVESLVGLFKALAKKGSVFHQVGSRMLDKWTQYGQLFASAPAKMNARVRNAWLYDLTVTRGWEDHPTVGLVPVVTSGFGSKMSAVMNSDNQWLGRLSRSDADRDAGDLVFVCCSGTLAPNMTSQVGLPYPSHEDVPSPFDHSRGRILIPDSGTVPAPPKNYRDVAGNKARAKAVEDLLRNSVRASGGRTMVLTTSNQRVGEVYDFLSTEFPDLLVMRQGDGPREEQMELFSSVETSVFVGTRSFWEGVDVPGPALSHVFIDKVMFPPYNDPVIQARSRFVEDNDGNPFREISCPDAAVMLAQGVGRLIRSTGDCGLVTIADPRVGDSWYAPLVLSLLDSATPVTRDARAALGWLKSCVDGNPTAVEDDWMVLRDPSSSGKAKARGRRGGRGSVSVVRKR